MIECVICKWSGNEEQLKSYACPSCGWQHFKYINGDNEEFETDLGDKIYFIEGCLAVENTEDDITVDVGLGFEDTYKPYLEMKKYYEGE